MVDAGQRHVVDGKREGGLGVEVERQRQGGADGAAVGDGDDVAAGVLGGQSPDRATDPVDDRDEAFATSRFRRPAFRR